MAFLSGLSGALGGVGLGEAVVRVVADTTGLKAGLAEAEGQTASTTAAMGVLWAAAGVSVLAFAASAVKAAEAHQAALAQLTNVAGTSTGALVALADAQVKLTGFTEDATIAAETQLAHFGLTQTQITQSIPVVEDYARAMGVDAATAATNIGKALLGSSRALKAVGINFKATGNQAQDFSTIMTLLQGKVGGASAAFAQTFAGKLAILGAEFDSLKIKVGSELLPSLTSLVGSMGDLLVAAAPLIAGVFGALADAMNTAATEGNGLLSVLNGIIGIIPGLKPAGEQGAQGMDAMAVAGAGLKASVGFLMGPLGIVKGLLGFTSDSSSAAATAMHNLATANATTVTSITAVADALKAQKTAQQALLPGVLGLIGSTQQLAADEKNYQKDLRNGHATRAQLASDQLTILNDQQSVTSGFKAYVVQLNASGKSQDFVMAKLEAMGNKLGLTKSQVDRLAGSVGGLHSQLVNLPASVNVQINLNETLHRGAGFGGP